MSSSSPSPPGWPRLGKKFESATRRDSAAKEQARRAAKEREISREQNAIRNGVDQRFPEGQEIPAAGGPDQAGTASPSQHKGHRSGCTACPHNAKPPAGTAAPKPASRTKAGSSGSARPPSNDRPSATVPDAPVASSVDPQEATREGKGDTAKIVVETTPPAPERNGSPIESRGRDTNRQPDSDPAIAEFRHQLAEQKALCEGLRRDLDQKDGKIKELKAEVQSLQDTLIEANGAEIAKWRAKFENVKTLLRETLKEKEELEEQLEKAKNNEKVLQRQLDDARYEAERRERNLRNRVEEAEEGMRRLRGECDGLRERAGAAEGSNVSPQTFINNLLIPQQPQLQHPQQINERRDSMMSGAPPVLCSSLSSRSADAGDALSSHSITSRTNSKGEKQMRMEKRKVVTASRVHRVMFGLGR